MEMMEMLTGFAGMVTALGGFEFVKWLYNRRNSSRISEAQADNAEFEVLKEQIKFLQEDNMAKEKRFSEQTEVVRKLNQREIELTKEIGKIQLELALKRCERKKCPQREPQNGY